MTYPPQIPHPVNCSLSCRLRIVCLYSPGAERGDTGDAVRGLAPSAPQGCGGHGAALARESGFRCCGAGAASFRRTLGKRGPRLFSLEEGHEAEIPSSTIPPVLEAGALGASVRARCQACRWGAGRCGHGTWLSAGRHSPGGAPSGPTPREGRRHPRGPAVLWRQLQACRDLGQRHAWWPGESSLPVACECGGVHACALECPHARVSDTGGRPSVVSCG